MLRPELSRPPEPTRAADPPILRHSLAQSAFKKRPVGPVLLTHEPQTQAQAVTVTMASGPELRLGEGTSSHHAAAGGAKQHAPCC